MKIEMDVIKTICDKENIHLFFMPDSFHKKNGRDLYMIAFQYLATFG